MRLELLRGGNLLSLGVAGGALPEELRGELEAQLRFTYKRAPREGEEWQAQGARVVRRPLVFEEVKLFSYDRHQRLVCGRGFEQRVCALAVRYGHTVDGRDVILRPEQRPSPGRYRIDWERLFAQLSLRDGQDECLVQLEMFERGLIGAPPGFGKGTLMIAHAIAHPEARVHIVTPSLGVMERIYGEAVTYFPDCGRIGGGRKKWGRRLTVLSADSVHHVGEAFADPTHPHFADVVHVDEVHRIGAPRLMEKVMRYQHARLYGWSATLRGRFDGADAALEGIFGPVIFAMSYAEAVRRRLVVPIVVEWLVQTDGPDLRYLDDLTSPNYRHYRRMLEGVWSNPRRNQDLVDRLARVPAGEQSLLLCATVDHLAHLKRLRPTLPIAYAAGGVDQERYNDLVQSGVLDPERDPLLTPPRLRELLARFRAGEVLELACTPIGGEGVDFRRLANLFLCTGTASDIADVQGPGRASRLCDDIGKEAGRVIRPYDAWDEGFEETSRKAHTHFVSQGWEQLHYPRRRLHDHR